MDMFTQHFNNRDWLHAGEKRQPFVWGWVAVGGSPCFPGQLTLARCIEHYWLIDQGTDLVPVANVLWHRNLFIGFLWLTNWVTHFKNCLVIIWCPLKPTMWSIMLRNRTLSSILRPSSLWWILNIFLSLNQNLRSKFLLARYRDLQIFPRNVVS